MEQKNSKSRIPQIAEAVFCILYLLFDLIAALIFFAGSINPAALWCGILVSTLGGGDAFHLVPRIIRAFKGDSKSVQWWSELGLLVSSVTMTIFYLVLFKVWSLLFLRLHINTALVALIFIMALLRIILCLFPQNRWFDPQGNLQWAIYRNLPFAILGACMAGLWIWTFFAAGSTPALWIGIMIILSFSFYFPVVLWAKKKPMVGMLMIPKTLTYMVMIVLLYNLVF